MTSAPRTIPEPVDNALLAYLTGRNALEFRRQAAAVELRFGDILHDTNIVQDYAYFPTSGAISTLYHMADGGSAELALSGKNGMAGLAIVLEGSSATVRAMVQVPGHAYRLSAKALRALMVSDAGFRYALLRYAQVAMTQMIQTAVCNRYHSTRQQLSRWILHSIDLAESHEIKMTQQLMAEMLGVRREGVSAVAHQMKIAGIIDYGRGHIRVLDRAELEACACECYGIVVREAHRLLPSPKRTRQARARG